MRSFLNIDCAVIHLSILENTRLHRIMLNLLTELDFFVGNDILVVFKYFLGTAYKTVLCIQKYTQDFTTEFECGIKA